MPEISTQTELRDTTFTISSISVGVSFIKFLMKSPDILKI